jgi:hypothetical protein
VLVGGARITTNNDASLLFYDLLKYVAVDWRGLRLRDIGETSREPVLLILIRCWQRSVDERIRHGEDDDDVEPTTAGRLGSSFGHKEFQLGTLIIN